MSYDLYLFKVTEGEDAAQVLARHLGQQTAELNPGPMNPEKEEEKLRLAKALMQCRPGLGIAEFDFAAIALHESLTEEEVRRRYRHIELNCDDFTGIQITLWDDAVEITFPYWHSGEQSRQVLQQVWEYAEALEQWGAFVIFDPQMERVLNLGNDFQQTLELYSSEVVK